ncbi:MAG: hypothetical protein CM1200mP1_06000 [Candidatus Neomarinimicrobiota bacterium]|nr:MAG: hypothetical protein CM1200mP1_06000 [Candidatus Neomarinimicrobiota bacterium]
MLGIYILGGNFSARLMQTVRDEQGLTYGIGSSIGGSNFGLMATGAHGELLPKLN